MSYFSQLTQNVQVSSGNSSVANVDASGSFVGTAASTLGVVGIQVSLKTDQNCDVYIEQSPGLTTGTGTVTTNGTINLVGSGTNFLSRRIGDQIYVSGETVRVIASISTDEALTVTSAFSTTAGSLSYQMYDWDLSDNYKYYASINNFGITVQAINSYVRTRVVNLSSVSATTYFRLQTVLCPIVEAVPRSLDDRGHLLTSISRIQDDYGFSVEDTPQGEMRTVIPYRLAGSQMDFVAKAGAVDASFWSTIVDATAGPGTVTVNNSLCSVNSGTNAASYAKLASTRRARYVGGHSNRFRANVRNSTNQASNTKRWGMAVYSNYTFTVTASTSSPGDIYSNNSQYFTVMRPNSGGTTLYCSGTGAPAASGNLTKVSGAAGSTSPVAFSAFANAWNISDGLLFQMDGSTFSCQVYKNGTATPITSFNGNLGLSYTPSTDVHTYEIYYTNVKAYFVVDGTLLHTDSATTTNLCATMHFNIYFENINSGNTTNTVLGMRNAIIHRLGPAESSLIYKNITTATTTVLKYGPGILKRIIMNSNNLNATTLTIYDNIVAAGPIIGTLVLPKQAGQFPQNVDFDCPFFNGLTMVTSAVNDITVLYE